MNSASAVIFFDGASKGNPRVSGAGDMVLSPDRLTKFIFSWGLGSISNNQDECYSLLLVTQLAKGKGFKSILIFRDSELLIKTLNSAGSFNNSALNINL